MPRTSAPRTSAPSATSPEEVAALASFLRRLAEQSERDPAFGLRLAQIARESGLTLESAKPPAPASARPAASKTRSARAAATPSEPKLASPPDPFAVLRERGEDTLRATLGSLDLAALRAIIRMHRLDPARISARWTARERLVALIVEQVRARASHGRAFERV